MKRGKKDERPLLTQDSPMLSDHIPGTLDERDVPKNKKPLIMRIFGGKRKKKENEDPGEMPPSYSYDGPHVSQSSSEGHSIPGLQPLKNLNNDHHNVNKPTARDDLTESTNNTSNPGGSEDNPAAQTKPTSTRASKPRSSRSSNREEEEKKEDRALPATPIETDEHEMPIDTTETARTSTGTPYSRKKTPRTKGGGKDSSKSRSSAGALKSSKTTPTTTTTTTPAKPNVTVAAPTTTMTTTTKSPAASLLSRPFGRDHVLAKDQPWVVQIAPAEWDPEESTWKYSISIQRRTPDGKIQDYTNGFNMRSLPDFYWLERALTTEYHGALLLPNLSIALGVPDNFAYSCQNEVDSDLLVNWLSDVLNGVRGEGELILKFDDVQLVSSESMEAFLYRSDLSTIPVDMPKTPGMSGENPDSPSDTTDSDAQTRFFNWVYPELCVGCTKPDSPELDNPSSKSTTIMSRPRNPLNKLNCTSPALGGARSFNVQDSFAEAATFDAATIPVGKYSDLLSAERDLAWSWRTHAIKAIEKLRILQEQEKHIGSAWKRFAISVSNLFAYEKDVESARLGDSKSRRDLQMPYRKLQKSAVDDVLRIIARHKVERSTPSLDVLSVMLSAYVADLSVVQPSVQAYLEGLTQLASQKDDCDTLKAAVQSGKQIDFGKQRSTIADQIQAGLEDLKKQLKSMNEDPTRNSRRQGDEKLQRLLHHVETLENRVLGNEALLKDFLTTLCRTAPIRTARMAHAYFGNESQQCKMLQGAAVNMKTKVSVASKESLSKMINRHHNEDREDRMAELQIVHRMVNIGSLKRFTKDSSDGNTEEVERGVELSKEDDNEEARKGKLRDRALEKCRERIGRWDAKLAMAIMEAIGVHDANVRVEETTRDLRMVRKYAIGLRENVQRCVEALDILRMSLLQGGFGDIRDLRHDFMAEMQMLFSTTYLPDEDAKRKHLANATLHDAGINLNDPSGWQKTSGGSCGGATRAYMDTRESGTEWLLESLGELLKEYNQRVEAVESFVYMECVGIQLEKHFSSARATALAAFEKKTDITSAINIATRKRMPVLVKELNVKLAAVGTDVSHTTVKETKEAHLESKALKQDLHDLAMRRLTRSKETSTERVIALMSVWSKEEESSTTKELKHLETLMTTLEQSMAFHTRGLQ